VVISDQCCNQISLFITAFLGCVKMDGTTRSLFHRARAEAETNRQRAEPRREQFARWPSPSVHSAPIDDLLGVRSTGKGGKTKARTGIQDKHRSRRRPVLPRIVRTMCLFVWAQRVRPGARHAAGRVGYARAPRSLKRTSGTEGVPPLHGLGPSDATRSECEANVCVLTKFTVAIVISSKLEGLNVI
jgi:hypothetical protein